MTKRYRLGWLGNGQIPSHQRAGDNALEEERGPHSPNRICVHLCRQTVDIKVQCTFGDGGIVPGEGVARPEIGVPDGN